MLTFAFIVYIYYTKVEPMEEYAENANRKLSLTDEMSEEDSVRQLVKIIKQVNNLSDKETLHVLTELLEHMNQIQVNQCVLNDAFGQVIAAWRQAEADRIDFWKMADNRLSLNDEPSGSNGGMEFTSASEDFYSEPVPDMSLTDSADEFSDVEHDSFS
ncbi:hypothetical protein HDE_10417 [Halotydeus destructor]|nr:hypothetical protein HDE_10417 [Halotydeus destructor]